MLFKFLGKTDIKISAIGYGTGFDKKEFSKDQNEIEKIIKYAADLGINFFDTSENYAEGVAEKLLGRSLKNIREKVMIATKFASENSSYKRILKSCDCSLQRLQTDYIDLYQSHWPNPKIPITETFKGLNQLIKNHKIRYVGMGNASKKELIYARKILGDKIVSTQSEYNLLEHFVEQNGVLDYCTKTRLTLIAYSPFDQGRLESLSNIQVKLLKKLSKKYSKTFQQIILRFLISHKPVIAIPKTKNAKHLIENVESTFFDLSSNDINEIDKTFHQKIFFVLPDKIRISQKGERNRQVYTTLEEAIANKLGYVPGPLDLAQSLKKNVDIKPVRLIPIKNNPGNYDLINGRIRYWAWVIAFGTKKPIPAYIRNDLRI